MKRTVLLATIVAIFNQTLPAFAQDGQLLPRATLSETTTAQLMPVPHVHRNISIRRLALGALIGGATGAAVGYALASRSCGATASPQECAGYGRLGAVVAGGVGVALGVHIAAGRP